MSTTTVNSPFPNRDNFDGLSGLPAIMPAYPTSTTAPTGDPVMIGLANTVSSANLGTTYPLQSLLTLTKTGMTGGNAFATRDIVTISGTVTGGAFISGARVGVALTGTQNHADSRVNALFAKVDGSGGTATAGYLDAIWADMGSTAPTGGWGTNSNCIRATNSTASNLNSIFYGYGKASFGFDLSDNSAGWITGGTGAATTNAGAIKVQLNGATRYINVYSTAP